MTGSRGRMLGVTLLLIAATVARSLGQEASPILPPLVPAGSEVVQTSATTPAYTAPAFGTRPLVPVAPQAPLYSVPAQAPVESSVEQPVGVLHHPVLFEADYLLWWIRGNHSRQGSYIGFAPVSDFVNSGDGSLPNITSLHSPAQSSDYGALSGLRLTLTSYVDEEHSFGVELGWFQFWKQSITNAYTSNGEVLLGPTYFGTDGTRALILASFPAAVTVNGFTLNEGRGALVGASSGTSLWGAEANARCRLPSLFLDRIYLLGGVRTLHWGEGIIIDTTSVPLPGSNAFGAIAVRDSFAALNQFWGGQVGLQARGQYGRFTLDLANKIGVGGIHEQIKVSGETVIAAGANVTRLTGGVLTQATNIGTYEAGRIAWMNEFTLKGGFNVTDNLRATVGYNVIWLSDVVRAGNAVDAVDPRAIQILGTYDPTASLTRPAPPTLQESTWWAQGITFGLDVSF